VYLLERRKNKTTLGSSLGVSDLNHVVVVVAWGRTGHFSSYVYHGCLIRPGVTDFLLVLQHSFRVNQAADSLVKRQDDANDHDDNHGDRHDGVGPNGVLNVPDGGVQTTHGRVKDVVQERRLHTVTVVAYQRDVL